MTHPHAPHLSRRAVLTSLAATATVAATGVATAATAATTPPRPRAVTSVQLPDGFAPEGITIGKGGLAYCGNRVTGEVLKIFMHSGDWGSLAPIPGTPALGLKVDADDRLFIAGGANGDARVLDTYSEYRLAHYTLVPSSGTGFVNDVLLTPQAAYFTDSYNPVLYVLPFGLGGALPAQQDVVTLPLTGIPFTPGEINVNGLTTTPDGNALLVVHSTEGTLYRVDAATGDATPVDLGGESLVNGDGLLRQGVTLYAVLNRSNEVAVITLDRDGRVGTVTARLTDASFDTPTTVAGHDGRLYLPNARFDTEVTETTTYDIVSVPIPG
ncbi:superoxide dismutase [Streptomyces sp. 6N223]|uniref:superoxide dismutase n=1 Tax=Streptomyces sp. 6N223 TaxID=3457412 RepID=UPI003FD4BB87